MYTKSDLDRIWIEMDKRMRKDCRCGEYQRIIITKGWFNAISRLEIMIDNLDGLEKIHKLGRD